MHPKWMFVLFVTVALLVACRTAEVEELPATSAVVAEAEAATTATPAPAAAPADTATSEAATAPTVTLEAPPPTATATAQPTADQPATAVATATPAGPVTCADVPRPAVVLHHAASSDFVLVDPSSEQSCAFAAPAAFLSGSGTTSIAAVYSIERSGLGAETQVVAYRQPFGEAPEALPFVDFGLAAPMHPALVVAPDDSLVAWIRLTEEAADLYGNELWVAAPDGSDARAVLTGVTTPKIDPDVTADFQRQIVPLRFSADQTRLFYTIEPLLGPYVPPMWNNFSANYDNVYAVDITSGESTLLHDCAVEGYLFCIGDFTDDGQVAFIDFVNNRIAVKDADGEIVAGVEGQFGYYGFPLFGPNDDLLFYSAGIVFARPDEQFARAIPGELISVSPLDAGEGVIVVSLDNVLPAQAWLTDRKLVVGYLNDDMIGTAIARLSGRVDLLEPWPASFVGVVPAD